VADLAIVNESSWAQATVSFFDENGNAFTPATVDYKIDCLTTGKAIQPWTTAGVPSAVMTIAITASQNAIINEGNSTEEKLLTVRANFGMPTQFTSQYEYQVENLPGVP
jgi:hypothetical protein